MKDVKLPTLRVFHVSSSYPPALGGMEKVVNILANIRHSRGKFVAVITSDQRATTKMPDEGFSVSRLKSFLIANATIMPSLLLKLFQTNSGDVVHVHITQAYAPEMVWVASILRGFRYVAHVHLDVPPSGPAGFLLKIYKPLLLRRVLHRAKFVIVFTDDQKKVFHKKYGLPLDKIKVVPNGVEDKFYYDKARVMHKKPRLLFVGRLGYQKNLSQLLHALDGISDQFETTLVGDGELEVELKRMVSDLRLKNVTFAGRKDGGELIKYYEKSDIFVLSSEREGMPLVLLEAMAMGLPIIATNVTGNRDVVKPGKTGLLVPYDDAQAFQGALLQVKADANLYERMSQTSRKLADQYSWNRIATIFEDIYSETAI